MDMAASIQVVIEEIILKLTKSIAEEYKLKFMPRRWGSAELCSKWKNIGQKPL